MIVASWMLSTVISVPPLFGLDDDSIVESYRSGNRSLSDGELHQQESTSDDSAIEELQPFEEREPDGFGDYGFGYSDYVYNVMGSAEVSLIYVHAPLTVRACYCRSDNG